MRVLISMLGAAGMVVVLLLVAAGIYGLFPDSEETIETREIFTEQLLLDDDYTIEGLQCECQSEDLEFDMESTTSGFGCKRRVLSKTQKIELPKCELET